MTKLIMAYDTETTGLWDFKGDIFGSNQPNLVQLGYKVWDSKKNVIFEAGHLVDTTQHSSWNGIEEGAYNAHHITEENVRLYGMRPQIAMMQWQEWCERCSLFIAHNDAFDTKVMQCFAKRTGFNPDVFSTGSKFCTMQSLTNVCKVPNPNGRGGFKWPQLIEAYTFAFGRAFEDAHNALADVNACGDLFWWMHEKGLVRLSGDIDG